MNTANVWADLFPIHENWQAGRIDLAHREARRLAETLDTLKSDRRHACAALIGSIFLALGAVRQAAEAYRYISNNPGGRGRRPWEPAILAFASEDRERLRESVKWFCLDVPDPFVRDEFTALLLLRAGFNEQAKEAVTRLRDPDRGAREWRTVRGAIALERGDRPEAIRLLREALAYPGIRGTPPYFLGSESLAIALEQDGRLTEAITVLENASRDKPRTFHRLYGSTGLYWLRIQEQLVRLCRKAGRTVEAAAAEEDLLHTLSHADSDHPILRRIKKGR